MTKRKATARTVAPLNDAHSSQTARSFFRSSRRGTQIHAAHLAHLHRAACIALANGVDPEARATLADIVEDAGCVLSLCGRTAR